MSAGLSAVTCLYDIGRDRIDGRSIDVYIDRLNATLRIPMPFTIFLDPRIETSRVRKKAEDQIHQLPKEALHSFGWLARVEEICRTSKRIKTRRDIAFHLPEYGVLVMSKIFMLQEAARLQPRGNGLIWLDAAMARWFSGDLAQARVDTDFVQSLSDASLAVQITPMLARALKHHRSGQHYVGTCHRLASGGDIYVSRRDVDRLAAAVTDMVENEWLPNGLWDNEQVALGCLLLNGFEGAKIVDVSMKFACVLERLLSYPPRAPRRHSSIIQRLRWHFGARAPSHDSRAAS
ncbi:MAG TPA: hypothetical protein VFL97_05250 [Nitrococcus sp.]|nr:hypothetical protein [Nitrococcus sp.]